MGDVWHLICLTCFGWNYVYDVCMNILWYEYTVVWYESVNKKTGGLGTKASEDWVDQQMNWALCTNTSRGWLDRWINWKFIYQGINTLIKPTDKTKFEGVIVR
jgi:hypothetical protein